MYNTILSKAVNKYKMLLREQTAEMQNIFLNNASENHFAFTNNGSDLLMLLISYHQFLYLCTLHSTQCVVHISKNAHRNFISIILHSTCYLVSTLFK